MSEVTRVLSAVEAGDPSAAAGLLPLVYDELRKLAAARNDCKLAGKSLCQRHRFYDLRRSG